MKSLKKNFLKHKPNHRHYWRDFDIKEILVQNSKALEFINSFYGITDAKTFLETKIRISDYEFYDDTSKIEGKNFIFKNEATEKIEFLKDGIYIITRWYGACDYINSTDPDEVNSSIYNNPPDCSYNRIIIAKPNYYYDFNPLKKGWDDVVDILIDFILVENNEPKFLFSTAKEVKSPMILCEITDYEHKRGLEMNINYAITKFDYDIYVNDSLKNQYLKTIFKNNTFFLETPLHGRGFLLQAQVIKLKGE